MALLRASYFSDRIVREFSGTRSIPFYFLFFSSFSLFRPFLRQTWPEQIRDRTNSGISFVTIRFRKDRLPRTRSTIAMGVVLEITCSSDDL